MKPSRLATRLSMTGSLLVSVCLPLLLMIKEGGPPLSAPGWKNLSLPADLVSAGDSLVSWTALDPDTPPLSGDLAENPPSGAEGNEPVVAQERPFIQMHGKVFLNGRRLYYFFDTRENRWFALAEGDVDERSGLTLLRSREGEQPLLMVLNGRKGDTIRDSADLLVRGASRL